MLIDVMRNFMPIRYRQGLGLWSLYQASRCKFLLYPYFYVLCGDIPHNLRLLPNGQCEVIHRGYSIRAPRDGILAFVEVLQDKIYNKYYTPQKGDTVIDIGAYVGAFSVKSVLDVGTTGRVVAIEPASSNQAYLYSNTKSVPNITIIPVAVGASTGHGELLLSTASPCHTLAIKHEGETEDVIIRSLDSIVSELGLDRVDFIKIDAEGYELEILEGSTKTLKNNKLKLAVASYHNLPNGEPELHYIDKLLHKLGLKTTIRKGYIYAEN